MEKLVILASVFVSGARAGRLAPRGRAAAGGLGFTPGALQQALKSAIVPGVSIAPSVQFGNAPQLNSHVGESSIRPHWVGPSMTVQDDEHAPSGVEKDLHPGSVNMRTGGCVRWDGFQMSDGPPLEPPRPADPFKVPCPNVSTRLQLTRRAALTSIVAGAVLASPNSVYATPILDGYDPLDFDELPSAGRHFFSTLLPPYFNRPTYCYTLGRGTWALEQPILLGDARVTIRTIVVRMADKRLWVLSPQWPTGEFRALLDGLGEVAHVVLPTNAWEHAAPMASFVRFYPQATVWVSPGQRGPFGSCDQDVASANMPYHLDGVLPPRSSTLAAMPPWANEFEIRTVYAEKIWSESAFYHRPSHTLMITDAVAFPADEDSPILNTDPKPVAARATSLETLLSGFDRPALRRFRLLQALQDVRAPDTFRAWFEDVIGIGAFDRILTLHFASPIKASPDDLSATLLPFLDGEPVTNCKDWEFFDSLNKLIDTYKIGLPRVKFDYKGSVCRPSD